MARLPTQVVHHVSAGGHRLDCGGGADRREPAGSAWPDVTCQACLKAGFVHVKTARWAVYAPESTAASVLLVLQGAEAMVAAGRRAVELRPDMRVLLFRDLGARPPDDQVLSRLSLRLFRGRPALNRSQPL